MKWRRFRSEDGDTWANREEWPEAAASVRTVLVYNACDGFHIWRKGDDYTPPGTHWTIPKPPVAALRAHRKRIEQIRAQSS